MTETEVIVHPSKSNLNLCLFYGIFNALPTEQQKKAFCGGGVEADFFMRVTSQWKSKKEVDEHGYNQVDLLRYLNELKKDGHISSFCLLRKKRNTMNLHKLLLNPPSDDEIYILFGLCTTGERRECLIRKLNNISKKRKRGAVQQEQVHCYHAHYTVERESTYHAVAIANDQGRLLLSDTARKMKQQITDVTVIARSLVCVHCVYVLELVV